jgi:hypothetical protein
MSQFKRRDFLKATAVTAAARAKKPTDLRAAQAIVVAAIEKLHAKGVKDEEIRRLFEAELAGLTKAGVDHD